MALIAGCINSKNSSPGGSLGGPPTANTVAVTVDGGPAASPNQYNVPYVTVKVCVPGSTAQCALIDHVKLDTGSWGLRLVGSVLAAANVSLAAATDAQGQTIEECAKFSGGHTWGPVAHADVYLAGEVGAKVPVQVLDDAGTSAAPPATSGCGSGAFLLNTVLNLGANGLLGVGVFAQDCGPGCVSAATPLPIYYGCASSGTCTAENLPLASQVANPVTMFATDNNGVIVNLPNLINTSGDASVQGELVFGIATQADNALPATLPTVLGTDVNGDFTTTFNGVGLPGAIDSGHKSLSFDDPALPPCLNPNFPWTGYYCPATPPLAAAAVNTGVGTNNGTNTVNFAIANPEIEFVAAAAAYADLAGGGGSTTFTWGMPFFYGRKIYVGIEQHTAGTLTGPFFAY